MEDVMRILILYPELTPTIEANIVKDLQTIPGAKTVISRKGLVPILNLLNIDYSSQIEDIDLALGYRTANNQRYNFAGIIYRDLFITPKPQPLKKDVRNVVLEQSTSVRPFGFNTYDVPPPANYPGLATDPYSPVILF